MAIFAQTNKFMSEIYQVPILRTRIKKKHITSMHLIAGFMFILIGSVTLAVPENIKKSFTGFLNAVSTSYIFLGIGIVLITIIWNRRLSIQRNNTLLRFTEIIGFLIIGSICGIHLWWMPMIYAIIGIITVATTYYLELTANRPEYIELNEKGIVMKRLNKKIIAWSEVKNFLIRHGNVTINLKNNTLYQFNAYNFKNITNKENIEAFAQQQIDTNAHKYVEEW